MLDRWPATLGRAIAYRRVSPDTSVSALEGPIEAALSWILTARARSGDGGISAGFDLLRGRWRPSYPETTGYTIPTLFNCAARFERHDLHETAVGLSDYLLGQRTREGGVAHWDRSGAARAAPVVFDTGQVIFGWLAAWRATRSQTYLDAATLAADWLVRIQDSSGAWTRNQHLGTTKVIDARVAWALLEVERVVPNADHVDAARRHLNWVVSQQQASGWFRNAAFQPHLDPYTHTIAYTAEGLLEAGLLLGEASYVESGAKVARQLLARQRPDGSLASTYDVNWNPTARSSCLTGNCQMALIWLRVYQLTGEVAFVSAARRALAFVAATQNLTTADPAIRGAIAGSFPIEGGYERLKYPNWAAKFFIDGLLALEMAERLN